MTQQRSELAQHWPIVLGAAIGLGCGSTQGQYVGSLFVKALQGEFGWTRGQIAAGHYAHMLAIVVAPVVGWLIDRYGPRIVVMLASLFLGLHFVGLALQPGTLVAYYALLVAGIVLGGATGPIAYTRAVVSWFDKSRGIALALTLIGTSVVAFGLAPALSWLIAEHGVRAGYWGMALLAFTAIPVTYFLVHERGRASRSRPAEKIAARTGKTLGQAAKDYRLYLLTAVLFIATTALVAGVSQLAPILTDRGLSVQTAGFMISVLAVATIVGRLSVGHAFDRMWAPLPAMLSLLAGAVGCLLLWAAPGVWALYVAVALIGFAQGAEVDITGYFISKYFGLGSYSMLFAVIGMAFAFGAVAGAVLAGQLYDAFKNYDVVLISAAAGFAVSGLLILLMGRYPDNPGQEAEAALVAQAAA